MKENYEVARKLNSIGKQIFIEYFNIFKSSSLNNITKEQVIDILISKNVSNYNGASIRYSNALWLFKHKKEQEALKIVINSKKVPQNIKTKAQNILYNL